MNNKLLLCYIEGTTLLFYRDFNTEDELHEFVSTVGHPMRGNPVVLTGTYLPKKRE